MEEISSRPSDSLEVTEPQTSRKHFLGRLGVTLLAAVGAGAFAQSAFAVSNCCRDCNNCPSCSGGCYCNCQCPGGSSYCWTAGPCLTTQTCVQCPC